MLYHRKVRISALFRSGPCSLSFNSLLPASIHFTRPCYSSHLAYTGDKPASSQQITTTTHVEHFVYMWQKHFLNMPIHHKASALMSMLWVMVIGCYVCEAHTRRGPYSAEFINIYHIIVGARWQISHKFEYKTHGDAISFGFITLLQIYIIKMPA